MKGTETDETREEKKEKEQKQMKEFPATTQASKDTPREKEKGSQL